MLLAGRLLPGPLYNRFQLITKDILSSDGTYDTQYNRNSTDNLKWEQMRNWGRRMETQTNASCRPNIFSLRVYRLCWEKKRFVSYCMLVEGYRFKNLSRGRTQWHIQVLSWTMNNHQNGTQLPMYFGFGLFISSNTNSSFVWTYLYSDALSEKPNLY